MQHLISSRQNQNSYSTLLTERNFFFILLCVKVGMSCLPILSLALHKVIVLACIAQNLFVELDNNFAMSHQEVGRLVSTTNMI